MDLKTSHARLLQLCRDAFTMMDDYARFTNGVTAPDGTEEAGVWCATLREEMKKVISEAAGVARLSCFGCEQTIVNGYFDGRHVYCSCECKEQLLASWVTRTNAWLDSIKKRNSLKLDGANTSATQT